MCNILPGILEKDWEKIEEKILKVKEFSKAIHIDIIDGKFADNLTFLDPEPFKKYSKDIKFELHMMVEEPINYLEPFAKAGFKRFMGHIEKMKSQEEFVAKAQMLGEVGLAVDGPTDLSALKINLVDLDALLLMTIKAGFSGQSFNNQYVEKVAKIKEKIEKEKLSPIAIEIDGGVNEDTLKIVSN